MARQNGEALPASVVDVDKNNLDAEWVKQPGRHQSYCERLAEATLDVNEAEVALKLCEAKIKVSVRKDPRKYGFEKATDDLVESIVNGSRQYLDAWHDLNQKKYRVAVLRGRVEASEHKKRALENLVELHGRSYFGTPRASDEATKAHMQKAEVEALGRVGKTGRYA